MFFKRYRHRALRTLARNRNAVDSRRHEGTSMNLGFLSSPATLVYAASALAFAIAAPVSAQDAKGEAALASAPVPASLLVKATDPQTIMQALNAGGYDDIELIPREGGQEHYIKIKSQRLQSLVLFADCDEAIPDFCETLVLSTRWDRETPISDAAIARANYENKYVSVWRNEQGNPLVQWWILTQPEGIAAPLFLEGVKRYLAVAQDFWGVAFKGDTDDLADAANPSPVKPVEDGEEDEAISETEARE